MTGTTPPAPVAAALESHAEREPSDDTSRALPAALVDAQEGAGGNWRERAEAAEARLAEIAAHVRERLNAPGRSGMSRAAAGIILGIAEGSGEVAHDG